MKAPELKTVNGGGRPHIGRGPNRLIVLLVVLVVVAVAAFQAAVTVPAGERGVLLRFGNALKVPLTPGLHFIIPFVDAVVLMNVQVQKSQDSESAASRDLQDVTTTVATNWHILPEQASAIYQDAVKANTAFYNAEDIIAHRDELRSKITAQLSERLKRYDVAIDAVNLTNITFSKAFNDAIEAKQVSQQQAQQAEYDLQKAKVAAQQKVVEAQAQSDAQKLLQQTLTPQIIQQQAIQKWNGVLPTVVGTGGVLPMIGNITPGRQ
jgi:regulator of protease activity HflC (stomatin/prohibitin superfamily)